MNIKEYKKFLKSRRPSNPVFLKVFAMLNSRNELDNLDDNEALEAVVNTTEEIITHYKK